ncbi:MAG: A/G-specific adenine glycosylase [Sphingomonadaceae bacterium]
MSVDPLSLRRAFEALLAWYGGHARALPWRLPPGSEAAPDPYRVWLSEVMLQQTTVEAVLPHFARFLARWPDVAALAAAPEADVMAAWAGLGYYSRARNLLAAARILAAEGFPADAAGWQRLPGVGPYTAAAIAAIAFGDPVPVVDTNVERVTARVFAIADPPPRRRLSVAQALRPHVPPDRPGDFAQALMDLGATVCTPRAPFCLACPLAPACVAHGTARTAELPVAAPRRPRPLRHGTAWWIEVAEDVALVRRPPRGLLGGMLALPGSEWTGERLPALPFPGDWQLAPAPVRHGFTHFELVLHVAAIRLPKRPDLPDALWMNRDSISGLPTLFAKAVAVARELGLEACP